MKFQDTKTIDEKLKLMSKLSEGFLKRAAQVDEEGSFPYENIKELIETGYTLLTVPKRYGGAEISLYELVRLQEQIAMGDGATALSIGWHMGIIKNLDEKKLWDETVFEKVIEDVKKGALLNGAASEPQTGSPTRGGKPTTTAAKVQDGWLLNGRKTFTTMSPMLDYFIVSASVPERDEVGNFLVHRSLAGVEIEETWDSIAMRGTGSHDLVLKDVLVSDKDYVERFLPGKKGANGWLLHIPACYLGIATAAQKYAIEFAKSYSPNSIEGTILDIPTVQQRIGEMELLLLEAKHFLYSVAKEWDSSPEDERALLGPLLGAVKHSVTNKAIQVVDLAMRIVGARSLSQKNPLQRYYRDVRAGLHNPPMDDMTIQLLAKKAIAADRL
ncbi:acyl-CoA dehydrogenase family protein [Robertmurraya andreesenii]|uniref:Alkylation response protein AidB-like acyl-CoA dehydrogenase n=1 Tax=Anoxybacillus andreesenii TaxID=1325932 RepID=A0ABT9V8C6_9BACL|nr:acyl-CoA dehydrogenase family protein [Robertmurraya andreesenii]MDQ0157173.1 alkylation response protein AidB-like acyl-CoA dehydrogenase [Robertmurraya andreesenii]